MAFHDVRLDEDIERGAQGGPRFKTTVIPLAGGKEKRNIDWDETRGEWDLSYGVQSKADFEKVRDFFYCRQGRAHSFRFKDWSDYEIGKNATNTFQVIGTGDGQTLIFQAIRLYASGGVTFEREITKLVSGTVRLAVNAVEQDPMDYSVDLLTGKITFDTAPPDMESVSLIAEFDSAVRFQEDGLDVNLIHFDAGSIPQIPVIEVRDE